MHSIFLWLQSLHHFLWSLTESWSATGANVSCLALTTSVSMLHQGSLFSARMVFRDQSHKNAKGIRKIRGQGVCKSPERQLGSSVCMDDVVTESQDTNRTSLKSELVDLGSVSGWEYDRSRTDCRQWCRAGAPALKCPTGSDGWASTSKGKKTQMGEWTIREWFAPMAGLAGDGHRGPGEGLGFWEGIWCEFGRTDWAGRTRVSSLYIAADQLVSGAAWSVGDPVPPSGLGTPQAPNSRQWPFSVLILRRCELSPSSQPGSWLRPEGASATNSWDSFGDDGRG